MAKTTPAITESVSRLGWLKQKIRKMNRNQRALLALIILLAIVGGFFAYKYNQASNEAKRLTASPQEAARKEVADISAKVGKLIVVPTNETPTLATVSDASKLKAQPFFTKAENGDKVLIYTQAKRAILYRPSTNQIIEVAPVNLGTNETKAKQ